MTLKLIVGDRHFSSWSMRAKVVVAEKGIEIEEQLLQLDWPIRYTEEGVVGVREYDIPAEPASSCGCEAGHLLTIDSTGCIADSFLPAIPRVPVLIHTEQGLAIPDVVAIAEYLDEAFPSLGTPILGRDAVTRARVRALSQHIHSDLLPLMAGMSYAKSFRVSEGERWTEAAGEQAVRLARLLDLVLSRAAGTYLFGQFTLADAMVSPIAQQLKGWGYDLSDWPAVGEYVDQLLQRPSVAAHLKDARRPYDLLAAATPGTPLWIARHYRYRRDLGLIHNWQTDVYHQLETVEAGAMFERALEGLSQDEIAQRITNEFDVEAERARLDVQKFFSHISPASDHEHSEWDFIYEAKGSRRTTSR